MQWLRHHQRLLLTAAALSASGERGRGAALRGSRLLPLAAAAHHAASDLAFVFGAAQELPVAFVPLSARTLVVHWSLVRKRARVWKLWPPRHSARDETSHDPSGGGGADRAAQAPAVVEPGVGG